ncbi:YutD family protein [Lactobacillaceae bacterium Scapto_B20]
MDRNQIEELANEKRLSRKPLAQIDQIEDNEFAINGYKYQLVVNEGDAFDLTVLRDAYNTFFSKYDYILGDIGYGQLRLTGFYADEQNVDNIDKISVVKDYLIEYCNFGSPYFILHNLEAKKVKPAKKRSTRSNRSNNSKKVGRKSNASKHAFIEEKVTHRKPPISKRKSVVVAESKGKGKRHFKIRQKQK